MARWNLSVEDTTDRNLRSFLGQRGAKKGEISRFVEEAVLEKLFTETVKDIKERNAGTDQEEIMHVIGEALEAARADRS